MPKAAVTMISLGRSQLLMLAMVVAVLLRTAEAADEDETPKCYRPDGSEADDTYRPCDKTASVSMCCHLGVGSSYNGGDACGSGPTYGLCGITGTQLWRESCTDPTWQDPACLQFCTTGDGFTTDIMITRCFDGSFCCGGSNTTCCAEDHGILIVDKEVVLAHPPRTSSTSSTSTSSTSSTTSSVATSLPSTTASDESEPSTSSSPSTLATEDKGLSVGAKAGIGIGAAALVLFAIAGVTFFLWKRKERNERIKNGNRDLAAQIMMDDVKYQRGPVPSMNTSEADSGWRGYEAESPQVYSNRPGRAIELL